MDCACELVIAHDGGRPEEERGEECEREKAREKKEGGEGDKSQMFAE